MILASLFALCFITFMSFIFIVKIFGYMQECQNINVRQNMDLQRMYHRMIKVMKGEGDK